MTHMEPTNPLTSFSLTHLSKISRLPRLHVLYKFSSENFVTRASFNLRVRGGKSQAKFSHRQTGVVDDTKRRPKYWPRTN